MSGQPHLPLFVVFQHALSVRVGHASDLIRLLRQPPPSVMNERASIPSAQKVVLGF